MVAVAILVIEGSNLAGAVNTFTDSFSGDLSQWTIGPSHLDDARIIGGELFLDGSGHLTALPGGWGVLQFNEPLGSSFVATWEVRITAYDYANFVLFTDPPWAFAAHSGHTDNGILGWVDINDPVNPLIDVQRLSGGTVDGPSSQRDIPLGADIAHGQAFRWTVRMDAGRLRVSLDDTLYVDAFDPALVSTDFKIGISLGEDSEGYIDNFSVAVIPEPAYAALVILFALIPIVLFSRRSRDAAITLTSQ